MTTLTHDAPVSSHGASASRLSAGLTFALVSSLSFGLSGAVARGLLDTGWSPGAATLVRVAVAALVVLPLGLVALRGRWALLRRNATLVVLYGVLAVAGAQFCYFSAVQHMQVAPALLIEYTAPAAVVLWLWLRHGQRPGPVTLVGAAVAAAGLVLVLDVVSGAQLSAVGVAWALGAMVGATAYFLISADEGNGLPPLTLAAGGLVVGATSLALLGLTGLLPMRAATTEVTYAGPAGTTVAWWVPVLVLGLVTAGVAYTSGIAAGRRLGSTGVVRGAHRGARGGGGRVVAARRAAARDPAARWRAGARRRGRSQAGRGASGPTGRATRAGHLELTRTARSRDAPGPCRLEWVLVIRRTEQVEAAATSARFACPRRSLVRPATTLAAWRHLRRGAVECGGHAMRVTGTPVARNSLRHCVCWAHWRRSDAGQLASWRRT